MVSSFMQTFVLPVWEQHCLLYPASCHPLMMLSGQHSLFSDDRPPDPAVLLKHCQLDTGAPFTVLWPLTTCCLLEMLCLLDPSNRFLEDGCCLQGTCGNGKNQRACVQSTIHWPQKQVKMSQTRVEPHKWCHSLPKNWPLFTHSRSK